MSISRRRFLEAGLGLALLPAVARAADAPPRLTARHAYVGNLDETIYALNADTPVPIASVSKLITAWVTVSSDLPMEQKIRIENEDVTRTHGTHSHLPVGSSWTRAQLLEWLLVTSDNRAAAALERSYPGGRKEFLWSMRQLATQMQLSSFDFGDPSGLSASNRASARDLGVLIVTLSQLPWFRNVSHRQSVQGALNVNRFAHDASVSLMTGKTGFTLAAGYCLAQAEQLGGRPYALVVLNSANRDARARDIGALRQYAKRRLGVG